MKTELSGVFFNAADSRNALEKTQLYLKEKRLNTVAYITAHDLLLVNNSEEQKKWWSKPDLIICEDEEVLKAMGITETVRIKEAKESKYLKELLRLLSRGRKEIFLLTKGEEGLILFEEELKRIQPDLRIVGKEWSDAYPENKEGLINRINLLSPEIILSQLPYPEGVRWIHDYGKYVNASLWFTMSKNLTSSYHYHWLDKINKFIYKKLLNRMINHSKGTEIEEI